MEVGELASVAVTAHDLMVSGKEASVAIGSVGVGEPFYAKCSAAGYGGQFGPSEFLGGGVSGQVNHEGAVVESLRFHPCAGAHCEGAFYGLHGVRRRDISLESPQGGGVPVIGVPGAIRSPSRVKQRNVADIARERRLVEDEVEGADTAVVQA